MVRTRRQQKESGDEPWLARRACAHGAALLLFGALAAGCSASPAFDPALDIDLIEAAPLGTQAVATDIIFPRDEGASRFLIRNWPAMQTLEGDVMWITGTWAHIGFFAVADLPPVLIAEARAAGAPGGPDQQVELLLNNTPVTTIAMPPGWREYEIALPPDALLSGWNVIELRFAHSLRPADYDPNVDDRRTLAAAFRRLELRHASGRPPAGNETVAIDAEAGTLDLPTDSLQELYAAPAAGSRLSASVTASFAQPAQAGAIRAEVELFDDVASTRLWSGELTPARPSADVLAPLDGWSERPIGLRLRVVGDSNGVVRWQGQRIEQPPGSAAPTPATEMPAPRGGALGRPDVLLIVLDAARADVFAGETGAALAPAVTALAAQGTRFARAWAPSSWTGQTIPALWTGMYPDAIGAEHWGSRLPASVTTFPELLYDTGYHTVLFTQHTIYGARPGLRHGFEEFRDVEIAGPASRAQLPTAAELFDDERPTLAVLHLIPPHEPYSPPAPFRGAFSGWYDNELPITPELLNRFDRRIPPDQEDLRDRVRRATFDRYRENVAFADHLVGRLLDDLRAAGRFDDALIMVTSDHGEAFFEHGLFLHTKELFEEFVRVPLVVKWPASLAEFAAVVDAPVSLVDIAPTLVDGLGIDDARAVYQGESLLRRSRGETPADRILYAYTSGMTDPEGAPRPRRAVLWRDHKLVYDSEADSVLLYDLASDPAERSGQPAQSSVTGRWLLQTLLLTETRNAALLLAAGGARAEDLDEETLRRLRALGYLR